MKKFNLDNSTTDKKKFYQLCIQFIKFGIVGLGNTAISLFIYYVFIWINKDLYLWGSFVGWIVSVANAFYWGNKIVFKSDNNSPKMIIRRLLKSYLTYGFTFLLSQVLLFIAVERLSVSEWLAPLVILVITIPLNFIINKFWTFKK